MNVKERFLNYVSFETTSDENSTSCPSTEKEKLLGEYIKNELEGAGLAGARMDEYGYVYALLPKTEGCAAPPVGFIAHMDTSPDAPGADIRPKTVVYDGSPVRLNDKVTLDPSCFPSLEKYRGQELIVTDGTTLLGADDKAGAAEIVTAMEYLAAHPEISHGDIYVGFTPDEEIGRGADHFDLENFRAEFAYTVDGGALGELEYENFNAASAVIHIHGVNIHPGEAKGKMKNAVLIGNYFLNCLPEKETPAQTEGYEGFYHVREFRGNESEAVISMLIRDHSMEKFEAKKKYLEKACESVNAIYGEGTAEAVIKDSYYNMKEKIEPVLYIIDKARQAMKDAGAEPRTVPIRGGTDGARLSYEGLPCPNLSTGGENFHSVYEYIPVPSLEKMVEVIVNLCRA